MTTFAVIDSSNLLVNLIIEEPTDLPPEGCSLIEIPDGYVWCEPAKQIMPINSYWNGAEITPIPDGYVWYEPAKQIMPINSYWNGTEIIPIPDGYFWDGEQIQPIPQEIEIGN